jgi:hypothetical protein
MRGWLMRITAAASEMAATPTFARRGAQRSTIGISHSTSLPSIPDNHGKSRLFLLCAEKENIEMSELFIPKPYARTTNHDVETSGVRAYRESPETVHLQLRIESPETVHLQLRIKGKKMGKIASVSLTFDEAQRLGNHLISEAA